MHRYPRRPCVVVFQFRSRHHRRSRRTQTNNVGRWLERSFATAKLGTETNNNNNNKSADCSHFWTLGYVGAAHITHTHTNKTSC